MRNVEIAAIVNEALWLVKGMKSAYSSAPKSNFKNELQHASLGQLQPQWKPSSVSKFMKQPNDCVSMYWNSTRISVGVWFF